MSKSPKNTLLFTSPELKMLIFGVDDNKISFSKKTLDEHPTACYNYLINLICNTKDTI